MIVVLMGVAGSGKTTIGVMLADAVACRFLDADSLHSEANIAKMSRGIPLTDDDRAPWLAAVHAQVVRCAERGEDLVVGCSALKERYRRTLSEGVSIEWVYLKGSPSLIDSRLRGRPGHYMKADMMASQFDDLEVPDGALVVDAGASPVTIVNLILSRFFPHRGAPG